MGHDYSDSTNHSKTWIYNTLLDSPAWHSVRGVAPQVFLHFYQKRKMEKPKKKTRDERKCLNCRELEFTYSEALKKGFTMHEFKKAIDTLIDRGFLDVVEYGGGTEKRKTVYGLSDRWQRYGKDDFVVVERIRHKRGFCSDEKRYCKKK